MQRNGVHLGIGCMAILPATFIGFAGLADGIGPRDWRAFAEVLGWAVVCLLAAALLAFLLARASRVGTPAYLLALATVAIMGALACELIDWPGLDAPISTKAMFTSSMQLRGTSGTAICAILIASAIWKRAAS